jgi:GT2 family glycosyltransferase
MDLRVGAAIPPTTNPASNPDRQVMSKPLIITVILNTNRREDTLACLASLQETTYPNQRVIILDNASTDGSVEAIQSRFPSVQIIRLAENLGYAGNNNVGIGSAVQQGADWIFVLNEDTIVAPDCFENLIEAAAQNLKTGILGPTVYHFDEPNVIQSAGGRLSPNWTSIHLGQNETDQGQYRLPRQVEWISGCALLVKRQVIEQVGSLDARFFYYWEETDWCIRALKSGWSVLHVPGAKIWHKGVQRDYSPSPNVTYYNTRNRFLFLANNSAPLRAWLYTLCRTLLTLLSWSFRPKWKDMRAHRDALWQGILDFFGRRWGMRRL